MFVTLLGIVTPVRPDTSNAPFSDAGDRQAVDGGWDGHSAAGAGVAGDGDRAVVGRVIELRLGNSGRQRQAAPPPSRQV